MCNNTKLALQNHETQNVFNCKTSVKSGSYHLPKPMIRTNNLRTRQLSFKDPYSRKSLPEHPSCKVISEHIQHPTLKVTNVESLVTRSSTVSHISTQRRSYASQHLSKQKLVTKSNKHH